MKYRLRPAAKGDVATQREYYALELGEPELGSRFVHAVKQTCVAITRSPYGYPLVKLRLKRCPDLRFRPVRGFPNHLIFYRIERRTVEVMFVVDGRRNLPVLLAKRKL